MGRAEARPSEWKRTLPTISTERLATAQHSARFENAKTRRTNVLLYRKQIGLTLVGMTTTVSSRGQTVIPAEIRQRHALTEQSRLAWIDDGTTIRVVPLPAGGNKYGRGTAKGLKLGEALLKDRREERRRERARHRS